MLPKKGSQVIGKNRETELESLQGLFSTSWGPHAYCTRSFAQVIVSIKAELYELGAPDISGFPYLDTDEARLIVAAFGKDGPPVAAKRLTVKGREFPVIIELTADDLAFPLTKVEKDWSGGW